MTMFKLSGNDNVEDTGFAVLMAVKSDASIINCFRKRITYNKRVGNINGSGHSTGGSNCSSVLSSLSFSLLSDTHPVLYIIDAKDDRFNEVRKPTRSSRVLELGVVIV